MKWGVEACGKANWLDALLWVQWVFAGVLVWLIKTKLERPEGSMT